MPCIRSLLLVLLSAALVSRAAGTVPALEADCPPRSADFDGDGVADTLQVLSPSWQASIVSGADSHVLHSVSVLQEGAHFTGAGGALLRTGSPAPVPYLVAGLDAGSAFPFGGLIALDPISGSTRWIVGAPAGITIGGSVRIVADQDEDGVCDVLTSAADTDAPVAVLVSGHTGDILAIRSGTMAGLGDFADAGGRLYAPEDLDDSGTVDGSDASQFLALAAVGNARADLNHDGQIDGTDFVVLVDAIQSGLSTVRALALPPGTMPPEGGGSGQQSGSEQGDCSCNATQPAKCDFTLQFTCPGIFIEDGPVTETVTVRNAAGVAIKDPDGTFCWNLVSSPPGWTLGDSGSTASILAPTAGTATIRVRYTYVNSDGSTCQVCAECNPTAGHHCRAEVQIVDEPGYFNSCQQWIAMNSAHTLTAVGQPGGGGYRWRVQDDAMPPHEFPPQIDHFIPDGDHVFFDTTSIPTEAGHHIYVVVEYGTPNCDIGTAYCQFTVSPDDDHDGIPDDAEPGLAGVYPCISNANPDSDNDGFSDGSELTGGSVCDPARFPDIVTDTDNDGIPDYYEFQPVVYDSELPMGPHDPYDGHLILPAVQPRGTSPLSFDTDNDGVQDSAEIDLGLNPLNAMSNPLDSGVLDGKTALFLAQDVDGDGIYDAYEEQRGWSTATDDQTGDGIPDGVKIRYGLDMELPNQGNAAPPSARVDSDGDGLSDAVEQKLGTNPFASDTDGDGIDDFREVQMRLNPNDPDSNHNGISDGQEDANGNGVPDHADIVGSIDACGHRRVQPPRPDSPANPPKLSGAVVTHGPHEFSLDTDTTQVVNDIWYTLQCPEPDHWYRIVENSTGYSYSDQSRDGFVSFGPFYFCRDISDNPPIFWNQKVPQDFAATTYGIPFCGTAEPLSAHPLIRSSECYGRRTLSPIEYGHDSLGNVLITGWRIQESYSTRFMWTYGGPTVDSDGDGENDSDDAGTRLTLDLKLDCTNEKGYSNPADDKDARENDPTGKLVFVDTGVDDDGIPAFARWAPDAKRIPFVPLVIRIPTMTDGERDNATLSFKYRESPPSLVQITWNADKSQRLLQAETAAGRGFRLWAENIDETRDPRPVQDGGDYVAGEVPLSTLDPLHTGYIRLFIEAVGPSLDMNGERLVADVIPPGAQHPRADSVVLTCVRMDVYDMHDFQPRATDTPLGFRFNMLYPDDLSDLTPIGGAITDGASLCLVTTTPQLDGLPLSIGVGDLVGNQAAPNESNVVGGFKPFADRCGSRTPAAPSSFPPDGTNPAAEGWLAAAPFSSGLCYYVPPDAYLDRVQNPAVPTRIRMNAGEETIVTFNIMHQGKMTAKAPFRLRRPPFVLVHGLFGASTDYWGQSSFNEQLNMPLPTRLYSVDYKNTDTSGYDVNFGTVPIMIREALEDYRKSRDDPPSIYPVVAVDDHPDTVNDPIYRFYHHQPAHFFHGVRYAATRVDVMGHSMGGQITRWYLSDISATAPRLEPSCLTGDWMVNGWVGREIASVRHDPRASGEVEDGKWHLQRLDNLFCGDVHRYLAMNSVFDGSPVGNLVSRAFRPEPSDEEYAERLKKITAVVPPSATARIMKMAFPRKTVSTPPTAFMDLSQGSVAQRMLEGTKPFVSYDGIDFTVNGSVAHYPESRFTVPWTTLASTVGDIDTWTDAEVMAEIGLRNYDDECINWTQLTFLSSDIIVPFTSQVNGDESSDNYAAANVFRNTAHSGSLAQILGGAWLGAPDSLEMADRIARLLSRPRTDFMLKGLDK